MLFKKAAFLIFVLLFTSSFLFAQSTGKIAGLVMDSETGEPLIGVNVIVQEKLLGASTDIDGNYVILNVPPGNHVLEFSYVGYQTVKVENVLVKINRTTRIDQQLRPEALELEEAVVVIAERPIVEADKTFSSRHFESSEIQALPVQGLTDVLELNSNINRNADGTISIRGGGSGEINFSVNGIRSITTNDGQPAYGSSTKSDNDWKFDINPLAVAQLEVVSGGFNAEYGNAQSGVINVELKSGEPKFEGAFEVQYRPAGKYHWGEYLYSKNQPEWQQWGNISAWYNAYRDTSGFIDSSLAEINYNLWIKNHTPSDDNILGVYDYRKNPYHRYLFSFGGPLGKGNSTTFFLSGDLVFNPTRLPTNEQIQKKQHYSLVVSTTPHPDHRLRFTGQYQYFFTGQGSGGSDIRWAGLWGNYGARRKYTLVYDSPREEKVFAQSINYKWLWSEREYLETRLTHQSERLYALQTPTPGTDRDRQLNPDPADRLLENSNIWIKGDLKEYRSYYTWSSLYNQASLSDYWELKSDFTSQISANHEIKAGIYGTYLNQDYNASSSLAVSAFIWRTGFASNYKADSWYASGYIQDKLEFAGIIANLGLRYDAYNFGVDIPVDKYAVFYPAEGIIERGNPETKSSDTFSSVSPRAGISFPIGEKTAFRVQYGHFRSMPTYNQALDNQTFNGWAKYGNPNLKPKLSINYEVGVQQNLWDTHQLDIVTFYNELQDQISIVYVESLTGSRSREGDLKDTYLTYANNGYGKSRGLDISFKNRQDRKFKYSISYSLIESTIGYTGSFLNQQGVNNIDERFLYSASDFLRPEDRTHRFNGSLSYSFAEEDGLRIGNFFPFGNSTIGLTYKVTSGTSYFYSPAFQTAFTIESNRRYPLESETNLSFTKNINLDSYKIKLGVRITNLFDNKQFTPISGSEELERWVLRGVTYDSKDYDTEKNEIKRPETIYNYFQTYRNIPRQIFFIFGINF